MAAVEDVYCTMVMSDSYLPGAAVLAHSLRDAGTQYKLAVLVTVDTLLYNTLTELRKLFDYVIPVEKIANPNLENLARLDRLDLRFALTKINLWRQEQFRRIVYIDADVVALRAPDELFNIDAPFAAAPDIGWPDCFNSGVMMLKPNTGDFWSLQTLAASGASFDGADQGLLNEYYQNRPWHRISFTYNCTPSSGYQYEPAYRHFRSSISMVHFIGKDKPWTQGRHALNTAGSGSYKELLGRWWSVFDRHYKGSQTSALGGVKPDTTVIEKVKDEQSQSAIAWASTGLVPDVTVTAPSHPPEAQAVGTEQPMTDPGEESQNLDQGIVASHVAAEPATFVPPQMDWDATRSEPPIQSKPEAASFPSQKYEMSGDRELFRAPASYPEPPKDMWYEVPKSKPLLEKAPPKIFPWEERANRPTRVFADTFPQVEPTPPPAQQATASEASTTAPASVAPVAPSDPWSAFTRTNAWDDVQAINTYVREHGRLGRRGHKPQLSSLDMVSPAGGRERQASLLVTDFPSTDERPSLPVTPAPIRPPTFWGEERDESGQLPAAAGVPTQADWNPLASIEQLRRASLIATESLPQSPPQDMPQRETPTSASLAGGDRPTQSPQHLRHPEPVRPASAKGVVLLEPDFGPGPATTASTSIKPAAESDDVDPKSILQSTAD